MASTDSTGIASAVSELVRNLILYAKRGEVILRVIETVSARGLEVIVIDEGRASRWTSSTSRRVSARERPS